VSGTATPAGTDDFEFPAPEDGGAGDAFPAPVVESAAIKTSSPAPAPAPAPAATTGGGDAFTTDPFGFPDDDFAAASSTAAASAPVAKGGSAGSTGASGGFAAGGFDDDFNASAFDKF
jgi:hypothetical protein